MNQKKQIQRNNNDFALEGDERRQDGSVKIVPTHSKMDFLDDTHTWLHKTYVLHPKAEYIIISYNGQKK